MDAGSKCWSQQKVKQRTTHVDNRQTVTILVHSQRVLCMHKNLVHAQESCACTRILTFSIFLTTFWLLFDSHILAQDRSRMVREGLRSILDPLNNYVFHIFFLYWLLVLPIIAYCLLDCLLEANNSMHYLPLVGRVFLQHFQHVFDVFSIFSGLPNLTRDLSRYVPIPLRNLLEPYYFWHFSKHAVVSCMAAQ